MLTEPTIEKLKALKLYAMITAWIAQRAEPSMNDLHFDERLALIVEAETLARDNKRLTKLLHDAKLRIPSACMEDVELSPKREIDKPLFRQLATGAVDGRSADLQALRELLTRQAPAMLAKHPEESKLSSQDFAVLHVPSARKDGNDRADRDGRPAPPHEDVHLTHHPQRNQPLMQKSTTSFEVDPRQATVRSES